MEPQSDCTSSGDLPTLPDESQAPPESKGVSSPLIEDNELAVVPIERFDSSLLNRAGSSAAVYDRNFDRFCAVLSSAISELLRKLAALPRLSTCCHIILDVGFIRPISFIGHGAISLSCAIAMGVLRIARTSSRAMLSGTSALLSGSVTAARMLGSPVVGLYLLGTMAGVQLLVALHHLSQPGEYFYYIDQRSGEESHK